MAEVFLKNYRIFLFFAPYPVNFLAICRQGGCGGLFCTFVFKRKE